MAANILSGEQADWVQDVLGIVLGTDLHGSSQPSSSLGANRKAAIPAANFRAAPPPHAGSGAHAAKPGPRAAKQGKDSLSGADIDDATGSTIVGGDPTALEAKFRTDIMVASASALGISRVNCDRFSLCISNAAEDFSDYTTPILKELRTEELPVGLLGPLLEVSLSIIGGRLGEKIGSEASKLLGIVVDKLTDPFKSAVGAGVDKALESAATVDDVENSIKQLVKAGKNGAKAISQSAGETIEKSLKEISIAAQSHALTAQHKAIMVGFLGVDPDQALEKFGVPSGASTMKIEGDILAGWVKAFHKKLLQHQNEKNADLDYMEQLSDKEIDRLAQGHANEARKQFVDNVSAAQQQKRASAE